MSKAASGPALVGCDSPLASGAEHAAVGAWQDPHSGALSVAEGTSSDAASVISRRYGETSVNPTSVNDASQAVHHEEQGERTLHAAWLEVGRHEQEDQDRRADSHPEKPLVVVGGEPVAVDREALERLVRQAETEDHLKLSRGRLAGQTRPWSGR